MSRSLPMEQADPPLAAPERPAPARAARASLRREVRDFVRAGDRMASFPRDPTVDVISHWRRVRSPLRTMFHAVVVGLCKVSPWMPPKLLLLRRLLGMKIGRGAGLAPVDLDPIFPDLIEIGEGAALGWKTLVVCHLFTQTRVRLGRVHIGRRAMIGGSSIVCHGVHVGDDVRVGAGCLLLPGVTVGDGAIVRAGTVVDRDVPGVASRQGVAAR